jgi:glycosyltransferase involved in cell wall biosynthesis
LKRILVIINKWGPKTAGGVEYHMLKVVDYWAHFWGDNCKIDLLLPRMGQAYAQKHLKAGVNIIVTDSFLEKETTSLIGQVVLSGSRILRVVLSPPREEYDVVVASSHYVDNALPAVFVQSRSSCKLVAYHHATLVSARDISNFFLRKVNDAISVPLLRKHADLVFAINESIRDFLISNHFDEGRVLITNNGIDEIAHDVISEAFFAACFVGRLDRDKGILDLVEIWKDVCSKIPAAKLAIVGDGPEKDHLIELIQHEHLQDRVTFFGYLGEERFDIMRQSNLLLLPSYLESWGTVVLEAMSIGLPTIAYDLRTLRSVWGNDVLYVSEGDKRAFGSAVVELLNDPEVRSEFSHRALKRSKNYLWSTIAAYEANAIDQL